LAEAVESLFGGCCEVAWLSGSYAYGGAVPGASDIDVVLVMHDAVPQPASASMLETIQKFIDVYLLTHHDAGLAPDLEFPGEYLTAAQIRESFAGRGFTAETGERLSMPLVESPGYWTDDWTRWFRAWLGMAAFSQHLCGDYRQFEILKAEAWKAILLFVSAKAAGPFTEEDILAELTTFGLKPRYKKFAELEIPWIRQAMEQLERDDVIARDGEFFVPQAATLRAWERQTSRRCSISPADPADLFLSERQVRDLEHYAAERWKLMIGR
jgi:hypothetical protein